MKKKWFAGVLSAVMTVAGMGLVACGQTDDGGKTPGGEEKVEYKITDGVFNWVLDASHMVLLKFYEDGTFYGDDMGAKQCFGKYKVVTNAEQPLTYWDAGADFIINKESEKSDADYVPAYNDVQKTTTTWVEFFAEDGTTPLSMTVSRSRTDLPSGYLNETPENIVAYADNKLHNVDLKGRTVRTLTHSPTIKFTKDDEAPVEKYKLMLSELPAGAAAGAKVQDYYISITQNSFTSYLSGLEVLGSYTLSGNTYTLNDDFNEVAYGTLTITVDADGTLTGATYTNNGKTIELVPYEIDVLLHLESSVFVSEVNASLPCTLDFKPDKTFSLVVNGKIIINGNWSFGTKESKPFVSFTEVTSGTISCEIGAEVTITWTGDLATFKDKTIVFTTAPVSLRPLATVS